MTMILSQSFIQKCCSGGPNFAQRASYESIIWNNCNIRIYYHSYVKAGVIFVSDLIIFPKQHRILQYSETEWINRLKLPNLVWSSLFRSKTIKKSAC